MKQQQDHSLLERGCIGCQAQNGTENEPNAGRPADCEDQTDQQGGWITGSTGATIILAPVALLFLSNRDLLRGSPPSAEKERLPLSLSHIAQLMCLESKIVPDQMKS